MSYIQMEDRVINFGKASVERVRGFIRKYPIFNTLLAGAGAYYSAQYGPAIRGGIKLLAPMVGLQCGE